METLREAMPGHQLQVNVKFIEPLGQTGRRRKFYQFTRDRRLHPAPGAARLPPLPPPRFAVERVQTDSRPEFGASFHWHLLDKGIDHVRIKPRTPG